MKQGAPHGHPFGPMQHLRLTLDQARKAVLSMVPTKWYAVSSAYRPLRQHRKESTAQMTRIYKKITKMHAQARTQALYVAERDLGLSLVQALDIHAAAVQRE